MVLWMKKMSLRMITLLSLFATTQILAHVPDEPLHLKKDEAPRKLFLPNRDKNKDLGEWMVLASKVYKELDKSVCKTQLPMDVFIQGYLGYMNLKTSQILGRNSQILTIVDYSLSSNVPRMWVINLEKKKIVYNTLVSHGQGTGEEFATKFSNVENSHQTSLGFFITDTTYFGRNGYSLRLHGIDLGYNDKALERAIVIHGAPYVSEKFIAENERLGRSWGCPALPEHLNAPIIDLIKEGNLFFAYYPDTKYLTSSMWLNKTPQKLNQKVETDLNKVMYAETDSLNRKNSPTPNSL